MTESTHESFEIAIERELHGALDAAEAQSLAEHLLGCASCRGYQRTAMEMNMDMTATSNLLSRGIVVEALTERVQARLTAERRRNWWMVIGLAVAYLVGAAIFKSFDWAIGGGAVLGTLIGTLFSPWTIARRQARELEKHTALLHGNNNDPFEVQRQELDRRLRNQVFLWIFFALATVLVVVMFLDSPHIPIRRMAFMPVIWIATVIAAAKQYRALRRERAALGDR